MDRLAKSARIGLVKTVPDGFKPGSDVANLGVLGFDVRSCYTGRSPLEALAIGVKMECNDVALRTNLVTLSDDQPFEDKIMLDYGAGEISDEDATILFGAIKDAFSSERFEFYKGVSYRHCLIVKNAAANDDLTPPHDISGQKIGEYLPKGELRDELCDFIRQILRFAVRPPRQSEACETGQKARKRDMVLGRRHKAVHPRLFRSIQKERFDDKRG